ncbi:MAG: primosomal protein N' [Cyanobacteriota bacterium]|nr:primosomal protein N' [Cyanobacteriota bacterium]
MTVTSATSAVCEPTATYGVSSPRYVEVLVDSPGSADKLFTYGLPADLDVQPGDILSVPFGAQQVGAIAIRHLDRLPEDLAPDRIKLVEDIVSRGFFPPNYWQLLERVASYYYTPLIQAISVALPPGLLGKSQRRVRLNPEAIPPGGSTFLNAAAQQVLALLQASKTGSYTWQYLQQQVRGARRGIRDLVKRGWVESYLEPPKSPKPKRQQAITYTLANALVELTSRQREVLTLLQRRGGEMWLQEFLQMAATSRGTVQALERKGCVVVEDREILRREMGEAVDRDLPKTLTQAQSTALDAINARSGYARILLHGVTGSGKTEVYLQAIAPILARGESALVLVPEIGLTPQLTDRFRARFGKKVCVYHSALSAGERYDTWRQMLAGEPQVVIGTRSAIFAPLPKLGIIILDEEHDTSFKQDRPSPTYHARTVAQWRAQLVNCPLILGSATPSLDTYRASHADDETSNYLELPDRVQSRPMPPVEVVDMRSELKAGNKSIFSRSLQTALERLRETGRQGILFINRRGHSTFVSCRTCGEAIECPHCDVSLAYHHTHEQAAQLLRCHYCGYTRLHPPRCPECDSPYLKFFGSGTQRVMRELERQFPQLRAIRFDSDTTRRKGAHRLLLRQFADREADLLVGTQMLTKGLDLPSVSLVGIVAADGLLHLSDYHAAERSFQTLTQVAGRAGRGDDPGQVILQTYSPEHPVVQAVQQHDYHSFITSELEQRQALNYPPYGRLILLRLTGVDEAEVSQSADRIATVLQPPEEGDEEGSYNVLGPVPAPVMRVADRFRWQILLKFPLSESVELPELPELENLRSLCGGKVSLAIDVDPLNFS